jgi:ketosteroid isomerase-like protein
MMRTFGILLLALGLGPAPVAQNASQAGSLDQRSPEQTLRALSDQWAKVPITRDASVLRRIWGPDFVYVESSGRVFTKDEGIADVARSTDKTTSAEVTNFKVRLYDGGNAAVVIGDDREVGVDKSGHAFDRQSRFTNVWIRQNGSWQCVSGHSSDLPSK